MFLHHVEEAEDVAHAGQRDALLSREVLDDLHLADVALRVPAPIRRRAMRLDEVGVLIKHQGAWMRLQDLGRDADRVQRLVHIAEGLMLRARASGHHLHFSEFSTWMMAGPRSTTHSTGKMHPTIGKTIREDACAARSCAPCRWRRRISVAWTRSNLAIGTPIWSDCTIDSTRWCRSGTPAVLAMCSSAAMRGRPRRISRSTLPISSPRALWKRSVMLSNPSSRLIPDSTTRVSRSVASARERWIWRRRSPIRCSSHSIGAM